jgi:two-component system, NarL family, response regulator DevR
MSIRVLLVDDHRVVREGLRRCLDAPDLDVVGEAATGAAAVAAAARLRPDVVVLDAKLPDMPGPVVCAAIAERLPTAVIAVLSAYLEPQLVAAAVDAGASAYLLKDAEELDLARAVRQVAAGERLVDPRAAAAALGTRGSGPALSNQELRVLALAAQGCTNREIGTRLFLSRHTVKEYLSNAMRKLEVDSRVEAVVEASRRGLLEAPALPRAS